MGGPIGENSRTFVDEVVIFTRKRVPLIGVNSWKDVMDNVKLAIADDIQVCCISLLPKYVSFVFNKKPY